VIENLAAFLHAAARGGPGMLFIVFVCILLWLLGVMTTTTLGGVLHVLLVVAIVFLLIHVIQGRPIGS
jgi:cellobiose-specific phosphotransferase system component IIC